MNLDSIQRLLKMEFTQLGVVGLHPIRHTPILHGHHFVGHLFRCKDLRAVWFADSGVVKFYGPNRTVLRKVPLYEEGKRAA